MSIPFGLTKNEVKTNLITLIRLTIDSCRDRNEAEKIIKNVDFNSNSKNGDLCFVTFDTKEHRDMIIDAVERKDDPEEIFFANWHKGKLFLLPLFLFVLAKGQP